MDKASLARLTSPDNYFEDFEIGQTIRHARGKTMTNLENVNITNMVMNTAQGHFNEDLMAKTGVGKILCYGGVNFSLVLGLSSQDTVENALAELGLNNIQLKNMVFHGDTIYATLVCSTSAKVHRMTPASWCSNTGVSTKTKNLSPKSSAPH